MQANIDENTPSTKFHVNENGKMEGIKYTNQDLARVKFSFLTHSRLETLRNGYFPDVNSCEYLTLKLIWEREEIKIWDDGYLTARTDSSHPPTPTQTNKMSPWVNIVAAPPAATGDSSLSLSLMSAFMWEGETQIPAEIFQRHKNRWRKGKHENTFIHNIKLTEL